MENPEGITNPKSKKLEEDVKYLDKVWHANRFCTYGIGVYSAAKFAAASCMYFDERYTNSQVGFVLAGATFFGLVTYVCSKVTRSSKNRLSRLEGLLNNK